jgi:integrase
LLIDHGESVKVVQRRLGHASATETLDIYSHPGPPRMLERGDHLTSPVLAGFDVAMDALLGPVDALDG